MREQSFDALLRDALLEAGWRECAPVWEAAEEPDFSLDYRRWRTRLLADPFAWAKNRLRPLWIRALRTAACILLACSLTLGALMVASPTVRAAVLNWLREISGNLITYSTDQPAETETLPSRWRITWLPEGWTLQDLLVSVEKYQGPSEKGHLTYACYPPGGTDLTTHVDGVTDADAVRETVQVQGNDADYYESDGTRMLLWENAEGFLFLLQGDWFLDQETLLRIAGSITEYTGAETAYEVGWVPETYEPLYRDERIGAAQEVWTWNGVSLTWRYVTDPICPFLLPDGESEEVSVGDVTAQFWAAEEPAGDAGSTEITVNGQDVEPDGSATSIGSVTITVSGELEESQTSALLWTAPDTHTTFLLEGALSREDLLRMAESVAETAPEPTPPSHHAMVTAGTAGGG